MIIQFNTLSSTASLGKVSTCLEIFSPTSSNSSRPSNYNFKVCASDTKLYGFESSSQNSSLLYYFIRSYIEKQGALFRQGRYQLKTKKDSNYFAYIQMKIEDPTITQEYLSKLKF
ncbi:MAG: hypothetical protein V4591_02130 [Bdellovibrionota bacterium]